VGSLPGLGRENCCYIIFSAPGQLQSLAVEADRSRPAVYRGLPPVAAPASRSRTEADRRGRFMPQGGAGVPPSDPPTLAFRAGVGLEGPAQGASSHVFSQ